MTKILYDIEQVACVLLNKDYYNLDENEEDCIDSLFYEEFDVDLYSFDTILRKLLPFVSVGSSVLSPNGLSEVVFATEEKSKKCLDVFIKTGKFVKVEPNLEPGSG